MKARSKVLVALGLLAYTTCVTAVVGARVVYRHNRNFHGEFTRSAQIAGREVAIWTPSTSGKAPLIVFSHGYGGSDLQSKFLMKALADHGYFVVAPNHHDAHGLKLGGLQQFRDASKWSDATYRDRGDDVKAVIGALKSDPKYSSAIDWSRIGLAGHSLGGYTVLGLAGAWPSWKMPGVKAVLALSPYSNPYILHKSLGNLDVPVMYQGGTHDYGVTPSVEKNAGAYDLTSSPAYFVNFEQAGHLAWTDLNPKYQSSIVDYSVEFFDKYLKGATEPDLKLKREDVAELRTK